MSVVDLQLQPKGSRRIDVFGRMENPGILIKNGKDAAFTSCTFRTILLKGKKQDDVSPNPGPAAD